MQNKCVAMILAGGKGSRLGALTKSMSKPAIPFGGKYRIIDFTLSNCRNSQIFDIGILTQYEPLALNKHIGRGGPWDLDRIESGVTILSPYKRSDGGDWYEGTASTIYENIDYIDSLSPDNILILSADHIYKMDYSKMIDFHIENNLDVTIAALQVSIEEASRFGIMNVDENERIYEFEEKPDKPKSNLASMGIYCFKWKALKEYVLKDKEDENSSHDFGKDILPKMLITGKRMSAYKFKGYWRDVGTVDSLWSANMDLLGECPELNLHDEKWKIYSADRLFCPSYIGETANIQSSLLNEGCEIYGRVNRSIIFQGVRVGRNSYIKDSLIFPEVKIGENVIIDRCIIAEGVEIEDNTVINGDTIADIGADYELSESGVITISENIVLERGCSQ